MAKMKSPLHLAFKAVLAEQSIIVQNEILMDIVINQAKDIKNIREEISNMSIRKIVQSENQKYMLETAKLSSDAVKILNELCKVSRHLREKINGSVSG